MKNAQTRAYVALSALLDSEVEKGSGRSVGLTMFIDPGRGDIYIQAPNGHRMVLESNADHAMVCDSDWSTGDRTLIADKAD